MQVGRIPWPESGRVHDSRRYDAVLAAGVRVVPQALGRWPAYRLHQAQAARHRTARVQRRTGTHTSRHGRHSAGREQVQTALLQGLRHTVQRLHNRQVRIL